MTPMFKPRRPMTMMIMMIPMTQSLWGLECPYKKKEERQMTPLLQPRRPMLLMVTPMRRLVLDLKCPEMKKEEKKTQSKR